VIETLRRQRHTANRSPSSRRIAATVSPYSERLRLAGSRLEPAEPVRRYERAAPGDMDPYRHQKTGRFSRIGRRTRVIEPLQSLPRPGWEFVHVCIDGPFPSCFSEIKPDQSADSAVFFLKAAVAYYKSSGYRDPRHDRQRWLLFGFAFRDACRTSAQAYPHRPSPKTNGKAERFIQTALREWPTQSLSTSVSSRRAIAVWLHNTIGTALMEE